MAGRLRERRGRQRPGGPRGRKHHLPPPPSPSLSTKPSRLLDPACSDGRAKNISFDPASGAVRGTCLHGDDRRRLERLLGRYHCQARSLLESLFPAYAPHLIAARASFRPVRVDDRPTSSRKDDRRLHIDAFASRPVQGRRILRVFTNVNPDGVPRVWIVGEPFAGLAARLAPRVSTPAARSIAGPAVARRQEGGRARLTTTSCCACMTG